MTTSLFKTTWRGFIIFCHEIGTNFIDKLLDKDLLTMSRVDFVNFLFAIFRLNLVFLDKNPKIFAGSCYTIFATSGVLMSEFFEGLLLIFKSSSKLKIE